MRRVLSLVMAAVLLGALPLASVASAMPRDRDSYARQFQKSKKKSRKAFDVRKFNRKTRLDVDRDRRVKRDVRYRTVCKHYKDGKRRVRRCYRKGY